MQFYAVITTLTNQCFPGNNWWNLHSFFIHHCWNFLNLASLSSEKTFLQKKKRKKRKLIQCGGYGGRAKKQRNKRGPFVRWAYVFMAEFFGRAVCDGPCVSAAELRGFFIAFQTRMVIGKLALQKLLQPRPSKEMNTYNSRRNMVLLPLCVSNWAP